MSSTIKHIAASAVFALAGTVALVNTTAVSAAMPGRVGVPDVTTPFTARTAVEEPLTRFAVVGDVGTVATDEWTVAARVASVGSSDPFDALVLLGDNVYPDGNPARLDATVFAPFGAVLDSGTELLAVLGNHDAAYAAEQVAALGMPGRWYTAQLGDVLFIGLDSNDAENPAQLAWLEQTLAARNAGWVIAAMHHPPFSAGVHASDEDTRDAFVPLFERYNVDLVLAGHDHDYQRSVPIGGVTYVVSGAAPKVRQTGTADFTAASAAVLHFVDVGIWGDRVEVTAISLDGTFDHVVLEAEGPQSPSAATYAIGGVFSDDDIMTGIRIAGFGAAAWLVTIALGWFAPAVTVGKGARVVLVTSALSVLVLVGGVGLVTVSLAT